MRRATLVLAVLMLVAACSSDEPSMPDAFAGMTPDEVGCVVTHGDQTFEAGPLGPSDAANIEPGLETRYRIGRTAKDVVLSVDRAKDGQSSHFSVSEISSDGTVVTEGFFQDSGNPGYRITCWRGSGT